MRLLNIFSSQHISDLDCPGCGPGRRSIRACDKRIVPAFRIARLRDLTFDAVSEDRHYHGRNFFCLCLTNVGISPVLLFDSPRVSFLRLSSFPLFFSHRLHIFLSLSVLLSAYPSSRAELRGKRQGGGIGRGSRVDEGRRRETKEGRAVR